MVYLLDSNPGLQITADGWKMSGQNWNFSGQIYRYALVILTSKIEPEMGYDYAKTNLADDLDQ